MLVRSYSRHWALTSCEATISTPAQELSQELGGPALVLGVRPRVQEADRDGLDVERA